MKPMFISGLLAAAALIGNGLAADNYEVDGAHSQVVFRVNHLGISENFGRFNNSNGKLVIDGDKSSIEFTIDAASVDTNHPKRDEHIKSPDFFNAKQFPQIVFKSTAVKWSGEKSLSITGDLTFLGVTKSISFNATKLGEGNDPWGNHRIGFDAAFVIKRSDFGNKSLAGVVGDEVKLMINIEAVKAK